MKIPSASHAGHLAVMARLMRRPLRSNITRQASGLLFEPEAVCFNPIPVKIERAAREQRSPCEEVLATFL